MDEVWLHTRVEIGRAADAAGVNDTAPIGQANAPRGVSMSAKGQLMGDPFSPFPDFVQIPRDQSGVGAALVEPVLVICLRCSVTQQYPVHFLCQWQSAAPIQRRWCDFVDHPGFPVAHLAFRAVDKQPVVIAPDRWQVQFGKKVSSTRRIERATEAIAQVDDLIHILPCDIVEHRAKRGKIAMNVAQNGQSHDRDNPTSQDRVQGHIHESKACAPVGIRENRVELNGVGAIVTGGASGLGKATARRLAKAGAKVTLFDLADDLGEAVADEIDGHYLSADVTNESAVAAALDQAEAFSGPLRVLVNCAGIAPPAKAVDRDGAPMPLSAFSRVIEINLMGTFNMTAQVAARLQRQQPLGEERGVIVNTASVAAFDGQIGQPAYAASKAGVAGLTLPLAREFARSGIRVMAIAPGLFLTPMLEALPEEAQASLGAQVPFPNRLGDPDEFAQLVESIIRNPMLNGEVIRLDGAIRMAPK